MPKRLLVLSLVSLFSLNAQAKTLVLGVIADLNGTECQTLYPSNSTKMVSQLLEKFPVELVVSTGDAVHGECLSYKGRTPYAEVVRGMWQEFDRQFVSPTLAKRSANLILAPGNHDAPASTSRETFRAENAEFVRYWQEQRPHLAVTAVESPEFADHYPYYWAFTHENVFFLVLNSTRTQKLTDGMEQKRWIASVLATPEARNARARIALAHIPPYAVLDPSVGSKAKEILNDEQVGKSGGLVDLMLDSGVDLFMVGHSHAPYPGELERTKDQKKMKILSMPCGHSPRKLYSKKETGPRGFAVVEVSDDGKIGLSVHNWSDGKLLPLSYFPSSIPQGTSKVSYRRMKEGYRASGVAASSDRR